MATDPAAAAWKERRRELGYRQKNVWLPPVAQEALDRISASSPGESDGEIITNALIYYAQRKGLTKRDVLGRLNQALIDVARCKEILETTKPSKGVKR